MSMIPGCVVCDRPISPYGGDCLCERCSQPCPTCGGDVARCTHKLPALDAAPLAELKRTGTGGYWS